MTAKDKEVDELGVCHLCYPKTKSRASSGSTIPFSSPVKSRCDSKAAQIAKDFNPNHPYKVNELQDKVSAIKKFLLEDLQRAQDEHKKKVREATGDSEQERIICNLERKILTVQHAIKKERDIIVGLEPTVQENLDIVAHLKRDVFAKCKRADISPAAWNAFNQAKQNLVYCHASQVEAYKNKDSNSEKLIEAQRELIKLGRLACPTCADLVNARAHLFKEGEEEFDEDFDAQLNAIEKQYAGSLSKQGGAGGASSSSLSVKNFGAGGASSQEQTCQGCAEGCDECEAGASAP